MKKINLFILFYLVFLQLPVNGIGVCIGSDGHIGLEAVSKAEGCNYLLKDSFGFNNTLSGSKSEIDESDHCGECEDLIISNPHELANPMLPDLNVGSYLYFPSAFLNCDQFYSQYNKHNYAETTGMFTHSLLIPQTTVIRC